MLGWASDCIGGPVTWMLRKFEPGDSSDGEHSGDPWLTCEHAEHQYWPVNE